MKKGIFSLCLVAMTLLFCRIGSAEAITQNINVSIEPIHFYFDGEADQTSGDPGYFFNGKASIPKAMIYQGTTYVPLRYFSEHMNQEVGWDPQAEAIWIGKKPSAFEAISNQPISKIPTSIGDSTIQVNVFPYLFYFNGEPDGESTDTGLFYNGQAQVPKGFTYQWSTYVPLRYLSEKTDQEVGWDQASRSIWVGTKPDSFVVYDEEYAEGIYGISIGQSSEEVMKILGTPVRKDVSELGYEWWIYNQNLTQYVQVGIQNGKVVDLYSNAPTWNYKNIQVGSNQDEVNHKLDDQSSVSFSYAGANFTLNNNQNQRPLYLEGGTPVIIYLDKYNQNKVTGIRFISKELLLKSKSYSMHESYYGEAPVLDGPTLTPDEQEQVDNGNAQQILDLTNVARIRNNLGPLSWNAEASEVGKEHSLDMNVNHYFDHVSAITGLDPFQRMEKAGITYEAAGENIAEGYSDGIEAFEGWMNSLGHRENILNDHYTTLGVGVYEMDYSQEFVTP